MSDKNGKIKLKAEVNSLLVPIKNSYGVFDDDLKTEILINVGEAKGRMFLNNESDGQSRNVRYKIIGFESVQQVIDIDVDDIVKRYSESLDEFYNQINDQKLSYLSNTWGKSWVHLIVDVVKSLNIEGLSCEIPGKDEFCKRDVRFTTMNVKLVYNGISSDIRKEYTKNGDVYILERDYHRYRTKENRYTHPENLVKAFVKSVDKFLSIKNSKTLQEIKRQESIKETIKKYTALFGNCYHEETTSYPEYGNRRDSYKVDSFYIKVKEKELEGRKISRKIKIVESSNGLFSFGSLSYLSETDVKKILTILNDD